MKLRRWDRFARSDWWETASRVAKWYFFAALTLLAAAALLVLIGYLCANYPRFMYWVLVVSCVIGIGEFIRRLP